ncbi:MAG: FecR domain-containing protein [Rhodobacteraceae bacterium]|nr:FecR domain-containing protein [Paracoccaceae bacterium]
MRLTLVVLLALCFGFILQISQAFAAQWVLSRVSGKVYLVAADVEAMRAKRGMVLNPGFTIVTHSGRALVSRGEETISVGPNTSVALSKYRSNESKTTLLQRAGTVVVDVAKRSRPHFTVETPFMAAVVKGTKFEVKVTPKTARVDVERGLVQVSDFVSGDYADVGPGQSAYSAPEEAPGLRVAGAVQPTVQQGAKQKPSFETPAYAKAAAKAASKSASRNGNSSANAGRENSNAGGNGKGNGSSNSGRGNSNAGGNGNGNGNSNSGSGNSNAGGNGNGNGNSNSGGGNSNAGGNGNGNGRGNSN